MTLPNSDTTTNTKKAKLISTSQTSLSEAGERLRSGHLVSFPTETVYGLGCHAIDPVAVKRVFEAKERPLTDPLIVHVNEASHALKLWDASSSSSSTSSSVNNFEEKALKALADAFWPGPLTIVAKASPEIPSIIMAGTGFVACRSPSHPIARSLIEASGIPIAAPSANKFGHVSPTRADHVMDDLGNEDVWIIDPDLDSDVKVGEKDGIVCDVGVESTVAKVEMESETTGIIAILRHGAVSSQDIHDCLKNANLTSTFEVKEKMQSTGENVSHVAPGQTIRHYSPNVQSFMVSNERCSKEGIVWSQEEIEVLKTAVIIDFSGKLSSLKEYSLAYRDLCVDDDSKTAAANVFGFLRWSETITGAERVFFPEIIVEESNLVKDALVLAVKDRLTRAASGVIVDSLS